MTSTTRRFLRYGLIVAVFLLIMKFRKKDVYIKVPFNNVSRKLTLSQETESIESITSKVLDLINEAWQLRNQSNVDIIQEGNRVTHVLRVLDESKFIQVPSSWCYNDTDHRARTSDVDLRTCFPEAVILNHMKVKETLRLIRDTFHQTDIKMVMTYGSLLGSIRYHRKMPFDSDFDVVVQPKDMRRTIQLFFRLASVAENQMRVLDCRPITGCVQIGLGCERDTKWLKPDTWKDFGSSIEFHDDIPREVDWKAYAAFMKTCAIYVDIYSHTADAVLKQLDTYRPSYRPLEGTLFRTYPEARSYLEGVYGSSLDVCVPKTEKLFRGYVENLPQNCANMKVPCDDLDVLYPRVRKLDVKHENATYEVALDWDNERRCCINSIFKAET